MGDMPLLWGARVGSEGAPFIIADHSVYARWGGSHSSSEPAFRFAAWGGLAGDLADAMPRGPYSERTTAYVDLQRLVEAISEAYPKAQIQSAGWMPSDPLSPRDFLESMRSGEGGDFTVLISGRGKLRFSFKDETDYDRIVMADREDRAELFVAPFGDGGAAVLWQTMGGCVAEIGTTRGGHVDEFVGISHGYSRGDKTLRALRRSLSARSLAEAQQGVVEFPEGIAVIADSSFHAADFVRDDAAAKAPELLRGLASMRGPMALNAAAILGVGTVLQVEPGTYEVFEGLPDESGDESPDARWCRLRRRS